VIDAEIDYGASARAAALEARAWLDEHAERGRGFLEFGGLSPRGEWIDLLREHRWLCLNWPEEVGCRGLSGLEAAAVDAEFTRAGVERPRFGMGENLVGPAIIVHGTDEQKRRLLPRILDGTDRYCQGFSEPDAGSDLANVQTRGVLDGDELVITGQKLWTSWFWDATMCFALVRTEATTDRHDGITYVLIPIERDEHFTPRNGVTFHPLRHLAGHAHFAETFFDEARAPLDNVIGGLGNGWRVSKTTLGNERGGSAATAHVRHQATFDALLDEVRRRGLTGDPVLRQRLARAYTQVQLIRYGGQRTLASLRDARDPGPQASTAKLLWSEHHRVIGELAMDVLGADGLLIGDPPTDHAPVSTAPASPVDEAPDHAVGYDVSRWQGEFLGSRSSTIWGGTSEIQRNIIAERVLGLPREPS
jgi:alkylation response protein AidB-like acyl-CoA dehydrogenase